MSNNIAVSWVDSSASVESYEEAIKPNTKVMYKYTVLWHYCSRKLLVEKQIFLKKYLTCLRLRSKEPVRIHKSSKPHSRDASKCTFKYSIGNLCTSNKHTTFDPSPKSLNLVVIAT